MTRLRNSESPRDVVTHARTSSSITIATVAVAAAITATVAGIRIVDHDLAGAEMFLLCVPIILVAIPFGLRGGLLAALGATTAFLAWNELSGANLGVLESAVRVVTYGVVGAVSGATLDRLHAAERHRYFFLGNVNHELRTPLNTIIGYLRLVDNGGENLTDELTISPIPVEASGVLTHAAEVVRPLLNPGVEITVDTNAPGEIHADRGRLLQILVNLLENAVKFTIDGHVRASIQWQTDTVCFTISDTGPGIPSTSSNFMRPFFQTERAIDHRPIEGEGIGLGLAIAQQLAIRHGGNIEVSSVIGEDTTVVARIPIDCRRSA